MADFLASDWSSEVITGSGMGNRWLVGKRDCGLKQPEVTCFGMGNRWQVGKKGSWAHGTGSHVVWKGKPLASLKIGSWAQGGLKPRRKRGLKVQSPIFGTGVILESKKKDFVFKSPKLIRSSGNRKNTVPNTNGTSWRHVGKNVLMTDMFSTSHSIQEEWETRGSKTCLLYKWVALGLMAQEKEHIAESRRRLSTREFLFHVIVWWVFHFDNMSIPLMRVPFNNMSVPWWVFHFDEYSFW